MSKHVYDDDDGPSAALPFFGEASIRLPLPLASARKSCTGLRSGVGEARPARPTIWPVDGDGDGHVADGGRGSAASGEGEARPLALEVGFAGLAALSSAREGGRRSFPRRPKSSGVDSNDTDASSAGELSGEMLTSGAESASKGETHDTVELVREAT